MNSTLSPRFAWSHTAWALLPIGCMAVWSCGGDSSGTPSGPPPEPSVATVNVTPAAASLLAIGDTVRFEAVARDAAGDALGGKVFAWSSSLGNVATVNSTGLVTAVANGTTTVSATTAGVAGTASVTVQAPTTGSLRLITTTVGRNLDPDGYTLVLDGVDMGHIGLDAEVTFDGLTAGAHSVSLAGIHSQCHTFSSFPSEATVVGGSVVDVPLGIECLGIPAGITLTFAWSNLDAGTLNIAGLVDGQAEPVQLTFSPAFDRAPAWSPDGTRLAFSRNDTIYLMSSDGTELRSFHEGTHPDWSPDGTRIAYDNGTRTFVFEPDGAGGRTFIGDGTAPDWSPDGTRIAVDDLVTQNQTDVFLMSATGQNRVNITDNAMRADREPAWSPDGSQILFRRLNRSDTTGYDLWLMDADGSNPTELLRHPGADVEPSWLPDERILFSAASGGISILDPADGSLTNPVAPPPGSLYFDPAWRPVP